MIKQIIKRSGITEEFSPEKVNKWGVWASKTLGSTVDWASIVLDTVNKCPVVCSSKQLQETLIEVCLQQQTWEYSRMAGRLYVPLLERIIYPNGRPTVRQLHAELFVDGLMVYLNYSEDEYEQIEKMIDHKQDLKYAHYQINQTRFKYALRNKVTGREYETPQFVYMRMAMALAENEPIGDRLKHIQAWYSHFSHNRLNPPTPNFVNLGTKLNGYASCCLYTTDDTAASLAAGDHIAYMMTCMSAGIGSHIKTRSVGDAIRGGLIQHQGKLPYYRAMVGAIGANLQNGRGGASTVYYTAYDPEVETIQKLRNPMTPQSKRIGGCHYNFGSNKAFARKVARNESYAPFSYGSHPELYEAQYLSDQSVFENLYNEYEKTATNTLNARDVVLGALTESYETGVHYLHMTDTINQHTPFKGKIYSSNLCFTGDTLVAVADGRNAVTIKQLAEEQTDLKFPVYSSKFSVQKSMWVTEVKPAIAFKTGNRNVIELTLSDGSKFKCTPDHRLALKSGEYVEAKDSIDQDLQPFYTSLGDTRKYRHINSKSNGYARQHRKIWNYYNGSLKSDHHIDHIENIANDRIENLQELHRDEHFKKTGQEFSGMNNAVHNLKDKESYMINLSRSSTLSRNPRFLGLSNMDIYNYGICLENSGLPITIENLLALDPKFPKSLSKNRFGGSIKNLRIAVEKKEPPIEEMRLENISVEKKTKFSVTAMKVISIRECGFEDVYDLNVEDNHNFNIITSTQDDNYLECSGILVHNCAEIALPTAPFKSVADLYKSVWEEGDGEIGLCSLAGVVVSNIESDEQYAEVAYYGLKMIDVCIHKSDYIFPALKHTAQARLSAGVGIMGLAHLMAKNGKKYDDQEGRNFVHELAETHMFHLVTASLRLGKELGNAPWMNKTKWPEGWLPIDTYEKRVDTLVTVSNKRDWETLRMAIVDNGGIRNSVLAAHMPGESSSQSAGTTNSMYPIRKTSIMKTNDTQVNYWVAPDSTRLKNNYQSAWNIKSSDMIKMYAVVQKWTDQAISADLYVNIIGDAKVSSSDMIDDYLDMVKYGLKTRYYVNSNTSKGVDLTKEENAVQLENVIEDLGVCESCSL